MLFTVNALHHHSHHAVQAERPQSMVQVLSHCFLKPNGGLPRAAAKEVSIPWGEIEVDEASVLGQGNGGKARVSACAAFRRPSTRCVVLGA